MGSTNVRVGSTIFGARAYKNKPDTSPTEASTCSQTPTQNRTTNNGIQSTTEQMDNQQVK